MHATPDDRCADTLQTKARSVVTKEQLDLALVIFRGELERKLLLVGVGAMTVTSFTFLVVALSIS